MITMNKRQRKKQRKKVENRIKYLNQYIIHWGRGNGKTLFQKQIVSSIYSKKYKPFNHIKRRILE